MEGRRTPRPSTWSGWQRAAALAAASMWLAQVSVPLLRPGRRALPTNLVVVLLATAAGCLLAHRRGPRRAAAAVAVCTAFGLAVEVVGTRTGLPFGVYAYTDELQPQLLGVPVAVAVAWAAMGLPAWAVACRVVTSVPARIGVGAVALTGWDLFLDPQMVAEGYWAWADGGSYRGIPLSNFAGWALASALLMGLLHLVVPALDDLPTAALYGLMAVMETLGFAVFFGDPLVAAAGGVVCLPLAVLALRGRQTTAAHERPVHAP